MTILLASLIFMPWGPRARAATITDYTINFTQTDDLSPVPTGSFVYDQTNSMLLRYTVVWDGATFDFTTTSFDRLDLEHLILVGTWSAGTNIDAPTPLPSDFIMKGFLTTSADAVTGTYKLFPLTPHGSYTVTEQVAPAPAPSNLVGRGILGAVFLWRRRPQILSLVQ
jgi:hypothetical protein